MLSLLLSFAIAGGAGPRVPMVACTARIYYLAGDRRISRHQVYVSGLDGSHRKRLSSNFVDCDGVRWIGDHRLAWIEYQPGKEDCIGFRGDETKPRRLVTLDMSTGHRRVIATGNIEIWRNSWTTSMGWRRGEGIFTKATETFRINSDGVRTRFVEEDNVSQNEDEDVERAWSWPGQPSVELLFVTGPTVVVHDSGGGTGKGGAPIFRRAGQKHTFAIGGQVVKLLPSRKDRDTMWCLSGSYAGSAGSHELIYRMDWKTDQAKCAVDDLLDIDFQADNRYYAGITWNKDTRPLGKKRVWARDVVAGDTRTGMRWIVLGGLVHATSVSIQPEK